MGSNPTPSAMMGLPVKDDTAAMAYALEQAALALAHHDVPVGAVIVVDGMIVAARHNERELTGDPTAHAEILAIRDAAKRVGSWRLDTCTLFVTLEPCPMCAGAAVNSRIRRVVFGANDPKAGAGGSLYNLLADPRLNHRCDVVSGIRASECGQILKDFFASRRGKGHNSAASNSGDQTP